MYNVSHSIKDVIGPPSTPSQTHWDRLSFRPPCVLMETSEHQQLLLAEDHAMAAATRWTTGRPAEQQKRVKPEIPSKHSVHLCVLVS